MWFRSTLFKLVQLASLSPVWISSPDRTSQRDFSCHHLCFVPSKILGLTSHSSWNILHDNCGFCTSFLVLPAHCLIANCEPVLLIPDDQNCYIRDCLISIIVHEILVIMVKSEVWDILAILECHIIITSQLKLQLEWHYLFEEDTEFRHISMWLSSS